MRILHLLYESKDDYFGIGGVGIRAYEIYKHLKERHDITLLCKKYPEARDGEIEGLKHIFVGTESKSLTKTLLSYAYHASQFVKKYCNDFDIIIEEFSPAIPTFFNFFINKPIVLQIQGYTGRLYFNKYNFAYALVLSSLERMMPKFYRNYIFVNEITIKKFKLPKSKNNIKVIPNGISSDLLIVKPLDENYMLYLGRIDIYAKGLDTLLDAYKEFYKFFPEKKLLIAGDGKDLDKFKAIIKDLPMEMQKNIELLGWVSGQRKIDVIKNASFCIFPSRHEVQPITIMEVLACEKAVVISDIPELAYAVKNRTGISFRTGDCHSLFLSMKEIAQNNEKSKMGKRGRELVKNLTWDKIALEYEKFLLTIAES